MPKKLHIRREIEYEYDIPFTKEYYKEEDINKVVEQEKNKSWYDLENELESPEVYTVVEIIDKFCGNDKYHEMHQYGEHNELECEGFSG